MERGDIALMKSIAAGAAQSTDTVMADYDPRRIIDIDNYFETSVYDSINAGVTEYPLTEVARDEIYKIIDDCFARNEKPVMKFQTMSSGSIKSFGYVPLNTICTLKFSNESPEYPFILSNHSLFYSNTNFWDMYCAIDRGNNELIMRIKIVSFD